MLDSFSENTINTTSDSVKLCENKIDKLKLPIYYKAESIIIKENIEKVQKFFFDLTYLSKISKNLSSPLTFYKGDNTMKLNNSFSFLFINLLKMKGKCVNIKINENKKKISWDFDTLGINFNQSVYLYKISDTNETLVRYISEYDSSKNYEVSLNNKNDYYSNVRKYVLKCYNSFISHSNENFIDYGSCIINENFKNVFSFVIDLRNLSKISSIFGEDFNILGSPNKIGSFWKFSTKFGDNVKGFLIVKNIILKKRCLICILETFGSSSFILKQEIKIKVTKIGENNCQITFIHEFKQKINEKLILFLKRNKALFLKKLKMIFEKKRNY